MCDYVWLLCFSAVFLWHVHQKELLGEIGEGNNQHEGSIFIMQTNDKVSVQKSVIENLQGTKCYLSGIEKKFLEVSFKD